MIGQTSWAAMAFFFCLAGQGDEKAKVPPVEATMEVTASRNSESVTDAPVSITVIDEKQIRSSATDNYADLLRGVPGVNVVQTSARDVGIRSRGASGVAEHRQLTVVDGRPVYLDFYGVVLWDAMSISTGEIKQIEVLRAPGSAIWGANALSGVINVRTKSPREMQGGQIDIAAGERGTRAVGLRWARATNRYSYKVSTSFFEQDAWPRDDTLPDGSPLPRPFAFKNEGTRQPKADVRLDWGTEDTALWSYKAGYGGTTGIFHSRLGPFAIKPGTHVVFGEIDRSTRNTDLKVYWNRLRGDAPNLINGIDFGFATDTYAVDVTQRRAITSNQLLVFGGDVRASRYDLSIAPRGRRRNEAGVFVEDSAVISSRLNLNAGVRVDRFSDAGRAISPRLSVTVKPRSNQSLHAAYSRAYRRPSIVDNFLETTIPNAIALSPTEVFIFETSAQGNEDLNAELIDEFEIGYTFFTSRSLLTAAVYANNIRNNIVFVPTVYYSSSNPPAGWPGPPETVPPHLLPQTFGFLNVGRTRDAGAELSLQERWTTDVTTVLSYTYQRGPHVSDAAVLKVNRPARHQASLLATASRSRWFASGSVTYTGSAFWADVLDSRFWGETRPYTMVNVAAGVDTSRRAQIVLKATNLFDGKIKEHVFGDIIRRKATLAVRYRF